MTSTYLTLKEGQELDPLGAVETQHIQDKLGVRGNRRRSSTQTSGFGSEVSDSLSGKVKPDIEQSMIDRDEQNDRLIRTSGSGEDKVIVEMEPSGGRRRKVSVFGREQTFSQTSGGGSDESDKMRMKPDIVLHRGEEKDPLIGPSGDDKVVVDIGTDGSTSDSASVFGSDFADNLGIKTLEGGRFDAFSKVSLTWEDVAVSVDVKRGRIGSRKTETINILKNVSGSVEPGRFMAIMGASGAGKSTLLNTMAFRNGPKIKQTGEVKVNGLLVTKSQMKRISAYVQQEDYFMGTLTVREVMLFHANLRMDRRISEEEKEAKVDAILSKLGLMKRANTLCGTPDGAIRSLSGGEQKRLSVAKELLMDPPLLFIDEPTSGLDAFMAESIVKLIRKLALANRTILCTIHQPTSEVFTLFDRVCLVAEGEIAFMGDPHDALTLFSEVGHPCPRNYNPADHYIFTLAIQPGREEKCREDVKEITGYYKRSSHFKEIKGRISEIDESYNISPRKSSKDFGRKFSTVFYGRGEMAVRHNQSSAWCQITENFKRSFKNTVRNPRYTRSRIVQNFIFGFLTGLAYFKVPNVIDPANGATMDSLAQNKSGLVFFIVMAFFFGNLFIQCQLIPMELPVVRREYQNGMYSTAPYFVSKIIAEIPYLVILPLIQLSISYFMIGFRLDMYRFLTAVVCCSLIAWCSSGLGWFIAAATGDFRIASAVAAPISMPFFIFGGLFQSEVSTPIYFLPIKYTSYFRYGYHMLMVNELHDLSLECSGVEVCPNGTVVLERFSIDPDNLWWPNAPALFLFGATFSLFAWTCLVCKVRR